MKLLLKSLALLVGGLLIGWVAGGEGIKPLDKVFFDLFKGALAIFLLAGAGIVFSSISMLRTPATSARCGGLSSRIAGRSAPAPTRRVGVVLRAPAEEGFRLQPCRLQRARTEGGDDRRVVSLSRPAAA